MFNTSDSPPRTEGSKRKAIKDYAEIGAAGAVTYGGIRTARAMKKLGAAAEAGGQAAEAWRKTAPASWKIAEKLRKAFHMQSKVQEIQFGLLQQVADKIEGNKWEDNPTYPEKFKSSVKKVPIHQIVSTQNAVNRKIVEQYKEKPSKDVPMVHKVSTRKGPKYYVEDGNHRIAASKEKGEKKIRARVFELGSLLRTIQFDLGMFRKYDTGSSWTADRTGRTLAEAATARKPSKLKNDFKYQRANENFNRGKMRNALISTNITGDHTDYLAQEAKLNAQKNAAKQGKFKSELIPIAGPTENVRKYKKGERVTLSPGGIISEEAGQLRHGQSLKKVKSGAKVETTRYVSPQRAIFNLRKNYRKELDKSEGFGSKVRVVRSKIRRDIAENFADISRTKDFKPGEGFISTGNRAIIQGLRKHHGTLPAPLSEEAMNEIKSRRPEWTKENREIAPGHTPQPWKPKAGFKIGNKELLSSEYHEHIPALKEDLQQAVRQDVAHRSKRLGQLNVALRSRASRNIQKSRAQAMKKNQKLETLSKGDLAASVNRSLHPMFKATPPEGTEAEDVASVLRVEPERVLRIRNRMRKLGDFDPGSQKGEARIARGILQKGDIFKKVKAAPVEEFPNLSKLANKLGPVGNFLKKRVFKFSAIGDAGLKAYVHGTSAIERIASKIKKGNRILSRKYPMAMKMAKAYAVTPLPVLAEAHAGAVGVTHLIKKIPAVKEAGVRKVMRKVESRKAIRMAAINFEKKDKGFLERYGGSESFREKVYTNIHRVKRLARDLRLQKTKSGKVVDERGRERTPEWRKPWVAKAAALTAATAIAGHKYFAPAAKQLLRTGEKYIPGVRRARVLGTREVRKYKGEIDKFIEKRANENLPTETAEAAKTAAKKISQEQHEKHVKNIKNIIEGSFNARLRAIEFDVVQVIDHERSKRRSKKWHERKSNRDLLGAVALPVAAALGIGGKAAGSKIARRYIKQAPKLKPQYKGRIGVVEDLEREVAPIAKKGWRDVLASSKMKSIQFDSDLDPRKNPVVRDSLVGSVEGLAGWAATDHLLKKLGTKLPIFGEGPEGSRLARGATALVTGGLGTAASGYAVNKFLRNKRANRIAATPNNPPANNDSTNFSAMEKITDALNKFNKPKIGSWTGGHILGAGLGGLATLGVLKGAFKRKKTDQGDQDHIENDTPGDSGGASSLSSKLKSIRFDSGPYGFQRPAKPTRQAVVQDRYRKAIRDKEINRHESNILRSGVAGAALGAALKHTPKAAGIGALAGAGAEIGTIYSQRNQKDVFGDSSISTRRIERAPYQAAGLGAGALLAHKIWKATRRAP